MEAYNERCEGKENTYISTTVSIPHYLFMTCLVMQGYPVAHLDNTATKKERTQILEWFQENSECHTDLG